MSPLMLAFCGGCLVVIAALLRSAAQRSRELNRRIQEHKEEMERRREAGIPFNPYLELSQLYAEEEERRQSRKRKRR